MQKRMSHLTGPRAQVYMWIDNAFNLYDPAQYGTMYYVMSDPTFWFLQVPTSQPPKPSTHF